MYKRYLYVYKRMSMAYGGISVFYTCIAAWGLGTRAHALTHQDMWICVAR